MLSDKSLFDGAAARVLAEIQPDIYCSNLVAQIPVEILKVKRVI